MSNKELAVLNDLSILSLGQIFVKSGYFKDARDASQAVVKILAGKELGLPPIASMTGINIIKGKIELSAVAMATVLKKYSDYDYRVKELTEEACEIEFFQNEDSLGLSRFTMEDAKRAGLTGKDNYKNYPRNMMFARAMSNGIRWFCPDVLGGPAYTHGELEAGTHNESDERGWINKEDEKIINTEIQELTDWLDLEDEAKIIMKDKIEKGEGILEIKTTLDALWPKGGYDMRRVNELYKELTSE